MIVKRIMENTDMDQIDKILNVGASVFISASMMGHSNA